MLARQRLDRRIPDLDTLRREVAAGQVKRKAAVVTVDWQFTIADAGVRVCSIRLWRHVFNVPVNEKTR